MKVIVFDLGGTLMEYKGMPLSWADYYEAGFRAVNEQFHCNAAESLIREAVEILKSYNPRLNDREIECSPQFIFEKALEKWKVPCSMDEMIESFFGAMHLKPVLYEETIPTLRQLKEWGFCIAALTDLPTAMPDELFRKDISELLQYIDLYVSSLSCGYRKPNPQGLKDIAQYFEVGIDELIFVGDEEKDRKTAENAGCGFVKIIRNETDERFTLKELLRDLCSVS